jgi:O-succinylbenzoate synthase
MEYQFAFIPIHQKFTRPLITNHGIWETRESVIIRLIDIHENVSYGEISPISWFGSETIEQAIKFCQQLPPEITIEIIFNISDSLPACQFAFESAWENLHNHNQFIKLQDFNYSCLLPTEEVALQQWLNLWKQGYKTFKLKIGVNDISTELEILKSLIQELPTSAKIRLDANGGLNDHSAKLWLETCELFPEKIEFIEQPLAVDKFSEILELSASYQTKIALDESVATLQQLENCYRQGWRDIFVIKPGIIGSPSRLRKIFQQYSIDAVFSSVFETEIGRKASLKLASDLSQYNQNQRALGFGINHYFTVTDSQWLEKLWNNH